MTNRCFLICSKALSKGEWLYKHEEVSLGQFVHGGEHNSGKNRNFHFIIIRSWLPTADFCFRESMDMTSRYNRFWGKIIHGLCLWIRQRWQFLLTINGCVTFSRAVISRKSPCYCSAFCSLRCRKLTML